MTAGAMSVQIVRPLLLDRRAELEAAVRSIGDLHLRELLAEVDAALHKIEVGTYGRCEVCHDPVEADRLKADPLVRFCLDHLDAKERMAHERDLQLATQIQSKLLPPADLAVGAWETHYCYEAAGPVGGDYCELIPGEDGGSLFFAVGDVAGKGVAASLLMTHLSAIFRSLLSLHLPLPEVMARANRLFCEGTLASHYATMVCGRAAGNQLEVCNAGHCPPLVVRPDGVERLECARLPLGMFCAIEYPVERVSLGVGESLVLYSDGVTEAFDGAGAEFGEERLLECIRGHCGDTAKGLARAVLASVAEYRGGGAATDDLTVLVVRHCD
jgi:phosphoserine phosphatase RsbU/P